MEIEILNYLRTDPLDMVLVCISTILVVAFTKKYFWIHVKTYIEKRQEFITSNIASTNEKLNEANQLNDQAKKELKAVKEKADLIIQNSKNEAIIKANQEKEASKIELNNMKEKAYKDIENQKLKALDEMKSEIGDLALLAASKIVKKEIDQNVLDDYVNEFIEKVNEA